MDASTLSNIFALALFGAIATLVAGLFVPQIRSLLVTFAPVLVSAIAIGATVGSLYFSEVADFVPCRYCWFQRIAMYPIAVILPMGLVFRDRSVFRYALALASIGLAISAYHVQLQWFPDQSSNSCDLVSPCTAKWVEAFGFVTIPQMAGLAFISIICLSVLTLRGGRKVDTAALVA